MKNFISRTLKAVGIAGALGGALLAAAPAKADVLVETPRAELLVRRPGPLVPVAPIIPIGWRGPVGRWHEPIGRWHGPVHGRGPRGWERGGWDHRGWRR